MGVVIPEGIETLHHSDPNNDEVPTNTIALCLLLGFTLMLLIEQFLPASHHHNHQTAPPVARATLFDEDDIEQLELGPAPGDQYPDPVDPDPTPVPGGRMGRRSGSSSRRSSVDLTAKLRHNGEARNEREGNPNAITFGLVIHSLADGLALGASAKSGQNALEAVVFLAIIVHKGEHAGISLLACNNPA
ncbi:ZIP Zinc/iron transport family protein [Ceratobasidium sp. AG-Ba]|nr:ZIP Zinc/iron transport family protein [Ceratobasidium sp. AG-Ba]